MSQTFRSLATLVLCGALITGPARAVTDAEAKFRLDHALGRIENASRTGRIVGGSILLAVGAGLGVGAFFASRSSDWDMSHTGAWALGVTGGVSALGGALILALPSMGEKLPQSYFAIPDTNLSTKVATGEDYLWQLSEAAHRGRIISGIILIALGAGDVALYATSNHTNDNTPVYTGVVLAGLGAAELFVKREPEDEYDNYQRWKRGGKPVASGLQWGVSPLPGGGVASLGVRF